MTKKNVSGDALKREAAPPPRTRGKTKGASAKESVPFPEAWREDLLGALLEGSGEGVCVLDEQGRIALFNNAAEILTGRNRVEVLGQTCREVFRCAEGGECGLDRASSGVLWAEAACHTTRADGKAMTLRRRTRALRDGSGRVTGKLSIFSDASLKETLHKQMVVYERLASLGELSASMVHEIGNPVSVILGFSRILVQQEGEDPGGEIRSRIFDEAQRCRKIVDHLLDYARSASRKQQAGPLVLKSIVDETLDLLSYRMRRQAVSWEEVWDVENSLVMADRGELKQVFLNVILNALQTMPSGGVIRIKGETRKSLATVGGDSLLSPRRKTLVRQHIAVLVEDEGPGLQGIDPERFFAPFYSTKDTGGGLGLPTCRKLLEQCGGSIRLEDRWEGGARAIIELPACAG